MSRHIVFLQSEIHNYHLHLIKYLISEYQYKVIVIYWDKESKTPYVPPQIENTIIVGKSTFDGVTGIVDFLSDFKISLIRVSGWMDKDYVKVSNYFKNKIKTPTIACSDTQWNNTLRQNVGRLIYSKYLRRSFSKIMVAGPYQFEYARKLGFDKKNVLFGNLSADSNLFRNNKKNTRKKVFLYIGRLSKEKGVTELIQAWESIEDKRGYILKLVGSGPLANSIKSSDSIEVVGYMDSEKLPNLMHESSFLVLPSNWEQWGVVMHEATLSSLPIICSDQVGAIPYFLISDYNGFIFESNSISSLKSKIMKALQLSSDQLQKMSENSFSLSNKITTETTCASLLSAISQN